MLNLSVFGEKFSEGAGILSLMDDLGNALADGDMLMMGGGNPGHVPEVQAALKQQLKAICADEARFRKLVGIYDPPRGDRDFLNGLAGMLSAEYGWAVSAENICLTQGSQGAFFILFNMLAGEFSDGSRKKIMLPMAPEYIGYADLGLCDDFFTAVRPKIDLLADNLFKYRVDFSSLEITPDIGALCVSRPTNPTGNVLTDKEINGLSELALQNNIPFIIDNAYGVPFPGIIYKDVRPVWDEHLIVCMSLSKFGVPAARTGIVVASREIIKTISGINAVLNLAPSSFGAMLTTGLLKDGRILKLSREIIKPFYRKKMESAMAAVAEFFQGIDYRVHIPEGSMFLWFWFKDLPVSSRELYLRLKEKKVLVVSGDYFFPGLEPGWSHVDECIRVTYSQDDSDVRQGLKIISEEVRRLYEIS